MLLLLLASIFFFQILDCAMTLSHVQRGGTELNPVMDWLLKRSDGLFVGVKLAISALGLVFLGLHTKFPYARHGLVALYLLFLGVVGWQLFLVLQAA
ncbi:MAG: DUF5658 family protein [Candidatus Eisenbacteria bacterium]|nr:DUF5658 family protein [Candidatus Eisenbacteria bacterium]